MGTRASSPRYLPYPSSGPDESELTWETIEWGGREGGREGHSAFQAPFLPSKGILRPRPVPLVAEMNGKAEANREENEFRSGGGMPTCQAPCHARRTKGKRGVGGAPMTQNSISLLSRRYHGLLKFVTFF